MWLTRPNGRVHRDLVMTVESENPGQASASDDMGSTEVVGAD